MTGTATGDGTGGVMSPSWKGRALTGTVLVLLVLMPAADRLAVIVDLAGARTIRVVELALLAVAAWTVSVQFRERRFGGVLAAARPVAAVIAALLLLIAVTAVACAECTAYSVIRPLTLLRGGAVLLASHVIFTAFPTARILRALVWLAGVATVWGALSILMLRWWWIFPFMLYSQTPTLHQPFTNPVQASHFAGVTLLLGTGAALALNRPQLLYVFAPGLAVTMAEAGSRSGIFLIALLWTAFFVTAAIRAAMWRRWHGMRDVAHVVASGAVAAIAILMVQTPNTTRALSIFGYTPQQIARGGPDEYRSEAWKDALQTTTSAVQSLPAINVDATAATGATPVGVPALPTRPDTSVRLGGVTQTGAESRGAGQPPASAAPGATEVNAPPGSRAPDASRLLADTADTPVTALAATPANSDAAGPAPLSGRQSVHNVYLEVFLYGGALSLGALFLVLAVLGLYAAQLAWRTRNSDLFSVAVAIGLALLMTAGINYGHVTFHLTFVWVLFGLITAAAVRLPEQLVVTSDVAPTSTGTPALVSSGV